MNRLIYYLILVNMITNIAAIAPRILFTKSNEGAITSMGLGLVAGLIITYIVIRFFSKFPGEGLPELMKANTSKWLYTPVLLYFAIMWYFMGLTPLISYIFMLTTFLTPEASLIIMALPFLLIISYGVLIKTESILNTMEIVFLLILPIGFLIFIKVYSSQQLNWDFVKLAIMNSNHFPDFSSFTAATYLFMGVFNIVIFNRHFPDRQIIGIKQLSIIGLLGAFVLFTSYFMPIGFEGFENIKKLPYPWISTTDSVRMRFGLIERLGFIFMLFFVTFSFLSIVIHWHVSAQFLRSIIQFKKLSWQDKDFTIHLFTVLFFIIALIIIINITDYELYQYSITFFRTLPIFVVVFLISILAVNRGAKS